ncbi:LexA repressor [Candidatus Arcanobacter lacustris]|uniref:LexA repressor n=1 Tax=Candidatus Arcanibacter lacustris TaxID=1607817 RepID=A0A0F5MNH9_9RICK|nr:LexA repressor [Candidatus Arcanobacter lacustris]
MNLKIIIPSYETKLESPYYVTGVEAGFPSPCDDHIEKQLDLNDHLIGNKDSTFFVRVSGDSMINAGIFDNDLLIVDKSLEAKHNSIVIAIINDEFTVKRLKINKDGSMMLMPENEKYQPIILNELEELSIWGVVTSVIRSFI